jgi:hypothetical protein
MPQSQRLSSTIPPVAFGRPACPKCKAGQALATEGPERQRLIRVAQAWHEIARARSSFDSGDRTEAA